MIKLNTILNESNNDDVQNHIDYLASILGFKRYQLGIVSLYGVYFITLPHTAYNTQQIIQIMKGFDNRAQIGYYPNVSKGSLSIKTGIKV